MIPPSVLPDFIENLGFSSSYESSNNLNTEDSRLFEAVFLAQMDEYQGQEPATMDNLLPAIPLTLAEMMAEAQTEADLRNEIEILLSTALSQEDLAKLDLEGLPELKTDKEAAPWDNPLLVAFLQPPVRNHLSPLEDMPVEAASNAEIILDEVSPNHMAANIASFGSESSEDNIVMAQKAAHSLFTETPQTMIATGQTDSRTISIEQAGSSMLEDGLLASFAQKQQKDLSLTEEKSGKTSDTFFQESKVDNTPLNVVPSIASMSISLPDAENKIAGNSATAAFQIDSAVISPEWGSKMAEKMSWLFANNHQEVNLQLDPPELGPLAVKIKMDGEGAKVVFGSEHWVVRDAVEQALPQLREMLQGQGIQLGNVEVGTSSSQTDSFKDQQYLFSGAQQQADANDTQTSSLPVIAVRKLQGLIDLFI